MATYRIYLDPRSGALPSGMGDDRLWYSTGSGRFFYKNASNETVYVTTGTSTSVPVRATRTCWRFMGFWTATSGGTQYIDKNGNVSADFFAAAASEDATVDGITLYAKWQRVSFRVTLDPNGGSGGTLRLYTKTDSSETIYDNSTCSDGHEVTRIDAPTRAAHTYAAHRAQPDGSGSVYVLAQTNPAYGNVGNALKTWAASDDKADLTIYAAWTPTFWTLTLDPNGGSGGTRRLYTPRGSLENRSFYDNTACTAGHEVAAVEAPTLKGYDFGGYKNGNTTYIGSDRQFKTAIFNFFNGNSAADLALPATWNLKSLKLTFSGGPESDPYGETVFNGIDYGTAIGHDGSWPTPPTSQKGVFDHWAVGSKAITPATVWKWESNQTAYPVWRYYWGMLTDYFGADGRQTIFGGSGAELMLVRSESRAARASVAPAGAVRTTNGNIVTTSMVGSLDIKTGDSAIAGYWRGPELLNPVCSFRIKSEGLVSFTLGKAYSYAGGSFMLVSVEYRTAADGEPTLTLRGVANEGADAINTWTVSFGVSPDHSAQDPAGAVSGGGELLECTTTWSCDPVVVYIEGEPVASDVVRGKATVKATTAAYSAQSAPVASGGFLAVGVPKEESDVDFTTYSFTAERSL
ncbi:MAG: hypothetical protein IJG84_21330 [Kiritimatiellae bacterium]|nr:hypothetical protein [Kiritimatiellia bacterium]